MSIHVSRSAHRTHLTIARRAALLTIGTATALGVTAGLSGTASALSPVPQPDLPIMAEPWHPEPPVVIDDLAIPSDQPDPEGPGDLTTPPTVPDPFPVPPELPGDLTLGEGDPEDPQPDPGDDDGGVPDGPDDLTADPDPTHPDDPAPDPTVPETTVPETTVPETTVPEPEVLDETASAPDVPAGSLAFTGNDVGLVAAGTALLAAGGLAAGAAAIARRRNRSDLAELG
jgi:hypothetical protein